MSIEVRLKELGIELPPVAKPVAAYVPAVVAGKWVYVSGQLPLKEGKLSRVGKLGSQVSLEEGQEEARKCAVNCLAALKSVAGNLDKVEQIVKVTGFVASADGFKDQPNVVDGASEIFVLVFGESGKHARAAVGVAELPLGACVEVELVALLK
jgi:enamine deaminase RidA (YjgF/YER057c/UK114 family)